MLAERGLGDARRSEVRDDRHELQLRGLPTQLLVDVVDAVLPAPEEHELPRVEAHGLATDLGANRAAGSRNQYALPLEVRATCVDGEVGRVPGEKVRDLHLAELTERHRLVHRLQPGREQAIGGARLGAPLHHEPDLGAAGRGHSNKHLIDVSLADELREVGAGSQDAPSTDIHILLPRVIVDEPHDLHHALAVVLDASSQRGARLPGAVDDDPLHAIGGPRGAVHPLVLPENAPAEATTAHQHEPHHQQHHQRRRQEARRALEPQRSARKNRCGRHSPDNCQYGLSRGVLPNAVVQAEKVEDEKTDRQDEAGIAVEADDLVHEVPTLETKPVRREDPHIQEEEVD